MPVVNNDPLNIYFLEEKGILKWKMRELQGKKIVNPMCWFEAN